MNAAKVKLTGAKLRDKKYYRHSLYPGGFRETAAGEMLDKHPERVLRAAVRGMLPKTRLGRKMIKKLKIYGGPVHDHAAQKPQPFSL